MYTSKFLNYVLDEHVTPNDKLESGESILTSSVFDCIFTSVACNATRMPHTSVPRALFRKGWRTNAHGY
jgi:hypothetical protein